MSNELILYRDFCDKAMKYTNFITWRDSKEYKINRWLKPICSYAKEESKFYGISTERDCGWYVEKSKLLKMLKDTIPNKNDDEMNSISNDLHDYIVSYKEPKYI